MANLTLRSVKGSPLTNSEVDGNFTSLNTELATKLDSATYTAADILTKLKTVDGSGSGLDADTLDGHTYSHYTPGCFVVNSVSRSAAVATIVTSAAHGFTVGQTVTVFGVLINGSDVSFNGVFTVASVPNATSFTFSQPSLPNITSTVQTRAQCFVAITDESIPDRDSNGMLTTPAITALTVYANTVGTHTGDVTGNILGNSTNVTGVVAVANGGTGGTTQETARTGLGLGSMATQASNAVEITGGTITSLTTDLAITDGGTGASNAASARTNLGLQIGSDVQAYSAVLGALAGVSATSGVIFKTGATTASATANLQLDNLGVGTAAATTGTGEIRATGDIITSYSDERLKENIKPIEDSLNKVMQLNGVTYNTNQLAESFGYKDKSQQVGLLAQDVKKVLPECVKPAPFDTMMLNEAQMSRSGENYMTVQYEKLVPLLVEAIKELNKKIEILENR